MSSPSIQETREQLSPQKRFEQAARQITFALQAADFGVELGLISPDMQTVIHEWQNDNPEVIERATRVSKSLYGPRQIVVPPRVQSLDAYENCVDDLLQRLSQR